MASDSLCYSTDLLPGIDFAGTEYGLSKTNIRFFLEIWKAS